MDERILYYIESLKNQLDGLPEKEIREAISYYEEYLNDALEANKDLDEVIGQLDSPDRIAGMMKTETSIEKAQRNPGLKNFTCVIQYAFTVVTAPLAIFLLYTLIIIAYSIVIIFFASAFAVFAGAVAIGLGTIYEALAIPSRFTMEIIGTLGAGLLGASICTLTALGLYKIGKIFIRTAAGFVRCILKKSGRSIPEKNIEMPGKKKSTKRTVATFLVLSLTGLFLFSVSGIPIRYFIIFNSMKPQSIEMVSEEIDTAGISKISIVTAHSHIKLMENSLDKIAITYEKPDWLDYNIESGGSMLSFYEKSNGRLPFFMLTSLHESRTEVVISIPRGYSPEIVNLESTGGYIYISSIEENINVKTNTGSIHLDPSDSKNSYNIKANTKNGRIELKGMEAGQKIKGGVEHYFDAKADKTISIFSSRGNISID